MNEQTVGVKNEPVRDGTPGLPPEEEQGWDTALSDLERGVTFFKNSFIRTLLLGNVFFLIASSAFLGFVIRPRETPIVLHYNVYFGVDLLGAWWQAYLLPAAVLFLLAFHLFLARYFYRRRERVASYLLLLSMLFLSAAIAISSAAIAYVNY